MKLLAFNYEYPPLGGGGGVSFQAIYDELAKRHDVTIVTSGHGELPHHETRGAQNIHRVPVVGRNHISTASLSSMISYVPSSWQCGRTLLSHGTFDLINTHFAVPTGPAPQDLADRYGIPNVLSIHGGDIYDPSKKTSPHRLPFVRGVVRSLLRRATRVVAQSTNTRDNARRLYDVDRAIDVVPLGIPLPPEAARDRAALGIGEDRFVMVTIGRIVARKGLETLLDVVRRLNDPRDLLIVIGTGPLREELERRAHELGVSERVQFVGRVSDSQKWVYLAAADAFVSTAMHEGFGLVFLEAMHAGLPIVCYNCGGQTDFLEDGRTGMVVPLGDQELVAGALRKLKADPSVRSGLGNFNRVRVVDFSIEKCAARYEELFVEVASAGR